jgi:hypothetical protein
MSEEDLKSFIEDVIADMVEAGELEAGDEMEAEEEDMEDMDDSEGEEEIDIEDEAEVTMEGEKEEVEEIVVNEEEDVNEIMAEIEALRTELQEVNLLNAKLLYSNKIFRAKNLKESQKVKVLEAFDRASNVKEVKLVFETLTEEVKATKTVVKENLGRASKASGMIAESKAPIVDVNPQVARWQKLAGIK